MNNYQPTEGELQRLYVLLFALGPIETISFTCLKL